MLRIPESLYPYPASGSFSQYPGRATGAVIEPTATRPTLFSELPNGLHLNNSTEIGISVLFFGVHSKNR